MSIFTKIRNKEIPSTMIYEDELCFVILDINPANKGHALVISNDEYECILDCPEHILSHMIAIAQKVAQKQKIAFQNFRVKLPSTLERGWGVRSNR